MGGGAGKHPKSYNGMSSEYDYTSYNNYWMLYINVISNKNVANNGLPNAGRPSSTIGGVLHSKKTKSRMHNPQKCILIRESLKT